MVRGGTWCSPALSLLVANHRLLDLAEAGDYLVTEVEVRFDQCRRGERQPLGQGNILVMRTAEERQEGHWCVASVLDVVSHRLRDITYVARTVVECAGNVAGVEDGHAGRTAQEVLPFVG